MDTNNILVLLAIASALVTLICLALLRGLQNEMAKMRLDLHELYFLTRDMALEGETDGMGAPKAGAPCAKRTEQSAHARRRRRYDVVAQTEAVDAL